MKRFQLVNIIILNKCITNQVNDVYMYISFLTIALPLAVPTMALRLLPRTFRVVICSDSLEISPTSCVIINVNLKLIHNIYIYYFK